MWYFISFQEKQKKENLHIWNIKDFIKKTRDIQDNGHTMSGFWFWQCVTDSICKMLLWRKMSDVYTGLVYIIFPTSYEVIIFILFYSILFYSIPFHSIPFHSIPFHSIPFHSIPLHSTSLHSFLAAPQHREFPAQELDLRWGCDLCQSCGIAGSLTCCAWLGIEPASWCSSNTTDPVAPWQELWYNYCEIKV